MGRRGFTLIELLIAMILTAVVASSIYQVLVNSRRTSHALAQRIDVQQNARSAMHYLSTVLRELDARDGDVIAATSTLIRFRSMRWAGVLCSPPALTGIGTDLRMLMRTDHLFGLRAPGAATDSILVYRDGDTGTRDDDRWLKGGITAVGTGTCADGTAAVNLTIQVAATSGGADSVLIGVTEGAPMRGFQIEEISLYAGGGGRWWLGQRTAVRTGTWQAPEPLLGPLQAGGLTLTYFDSTGAAATTLAEVTTVGITVRGESSERARLARTVTDFVRDSLTTRVALRNNTN